MKKNKDKIQIYLSRHVKAQNLGINDIEIIDKECGTIGVKRDQIYDRLSRLSERERRAEIHVLMDMAHIELRILTRDPGTRPEPTRKFGSGQQIIDLVSGRVKALFTR